MEQFLTSGCSENYNVLKRPLILPREMYLKTSRHMGRYPEENHQF
jgi:hypothetical protein